MASKIVPPAGEPETTSSVTTDESRELEIRIRPLRLGFWEYSGTRAQLEAEGFIPPGTNWPEGTRRGGFDVGPIRFSLRRTRPEWLKGPMRLWTTGDHWTLRGELIDGPDRIALNILDKKHDLAQEIYWQSAAGRLVRMSRTEAALRASEDGAFQAFKKNVLPPRTEPSPKRKANAA